MRWQQLSLEIFHGLPLSCSFWKLIHIIGVVRTIAPGVRPHLLISVLPCRGSILPLIAFSDGYNKSSPLYLPTRVLRKVFTRPQTIHVLRLGPWPNIYVDMHSWAYHSYNSPSKFFFLAPRGERRILMSLQLLCARHIPPLTAKTLFELPKACS